MPEVFVGQSLYSRAVLIDTGVFRALADVRDSHHRAAADCLHTLAKLRFHLFVSVPTIHESHRRLLFDLGEQVARTFLDRLIDGAVNIEFTNDDDETGGRSLLDRYSGQGMTLTDAVNMSLMSRLGIARAFSFDKHFLQAGFLRIPPLHV